ncbi:sulfotransferase 1C3-like [Ylistrum balloti]|uniref:sulfotransferase 1C3-like n=1 Tax=Ylistrum balloti TaxID=509963 RepID=UPI002905A300|nr:sulfotransferase 1C3-like [Ylistrum balloti]
MDIIEMTDEQGNWYKYKRYDGRPYVPLVYGNVKDQLQLLDSYEFRNDDVFLCTYPKSGTHWVHNIINMLRTGSMKHQGGHELMEFHDIKRLDNMSHPRTIATHITYNILPSTIKCGVGKIVYVMRNPKDVFVSLKCFLGLLKKNVYEGDTDGLLRIFLSDEFGIGVGGSWFNHTKEWDNAKSVNTALNIHTIKYEDIKRDPYGEIEKLAKFLETDSSVTFLDNIVKHIEFDRMKEEHTKSAGATEQWAHLCENGRLPLYRKGIIGDWRNMLTVSQNEVFDAAIKDKLSTLVQEGFPSDECHDVMRFENRQSGLQQIKSTGAQEVLSEMDDRRRREKNILVFGVKEQTSSDGKERKGKDEKEIEEMLRASSLPSEARKCVTKIFRLGKFDKEKEDQF